MNGFASLALAVEKDQLALAEAAFVPRVVGQTWQAAADPRVLCAAVAWEWTAVAAPALEIPAVLRRVSVHFQAVLFGPAEE